MAKRVRPQHVMPKKWEAWKAHAQSPEGFAERASRAREILHAQLTFEDVMSGYKFYRRVRRDDVAACPRDGVGPDGEPGTLPPLAVFSYSWFSWQGRRLSRTQRAFRFVERMIPERVADEEIGDAEELIRRLSCDPACRYVRARVSWVAFRTCVVVLKNALVYVANRALGRRTE